MPEKKAVGRPPRYKSKEDIEEKIERYFKSCGGEILTDKEGMPVLDKYGQPVRINQHPPTVTGLALALGFTNRQALLNYQSKREFVDTITRAKSKVEEYAEERLFDKDGSGGAQFSLRNNFKGWNVKTELDEEEQRARIEQIRAQAKHLNRDEDEAEEVTNDGFLKALEGKALEDWADEEES